MDWVVWRACNPIQIYDSLICMSIEFISLSLAIITISFKDLSMSNGIVEFIKKKENEKSTTAQQRQNIYGNLLKLWLLTAIKTCIQCCTSFSLRFRIRFHFINVSNQNNGTIKKQYVSRVTVACIRIGWVQQEKSAKGKNDRECVIENPSFE